MQRTSFLALLAALALGLFGCGDDDGPTPGTDAGPGVDGGPGTDSEVPSNTIVDVAVAAGNFTQLVAALQAAGLDDDLAGPGPFTVFAPTDAAFEALAAVPEGDALTQVLLYHVVSGRVPASALAEGVNLPTSLNDLTLVVTKTGASVSLNSGVMVTTADIEADNGVIHVIDAVLLPPTIADMAGHAGLTELVGALSAAELVGTVAGEGPFTVFAPTNEAFAALPAVPSGDDLTEVLLYHVVAGAAVPSTAVPASASSAAPARWFEGEGTAPTLTLFFDTSSGVSVNGAADVVIADVRCTNGIVHVIDSVLLPLNIPGIATAAGFSQLLSAVGAAAEVAPGTSVAAALSGDGPLTVFAPTNAAFEAIAATVEGLTAEQVRDVLLYHVVAGGVLSTDLAGIPGGTAASLLGDDLTFDLAPTPPTVEGAGIIATDIIGTNGVVHVVNAVLIPPALR